MWGREKNSFVSFASCKRRPKIRRKTKLSKVSYKMGKRDTKKAAMCILEGRQRKEAEEAGDIWCNRKKRKKNRKTARKEGKK